MESLISFRLLAPFFHNDTPKIYCIFFRVQSHNATLSRSEGQKEWKNHFQFSRMEIKIVLRNTKIIFFIAWTQFITLAHGKVTTMPSSTQQKSERDFLWVINARQRFNATSKTNLNSNTRELQRIHGWKLWAKSTKQKFIALI